MANGDYASFSLKKDVIEQVRRLQKKVALVGVGNLPPTLKLEDFGQSSLVSAGLRALEEMLTKPKRRRRA